MREKDKTRPGESYQYLGKVRQNSNLSNAGTNNPKDILNLHEMRFEMGFCTVYIFRNFSFLLQS